MRPGEVASIRYLSPSNSPSFGAHYNMHQGNIKTANFSCLFGPHFTEHLQTMPVVHGMNVPIACLTESAISDKPGGDKLIQAEERRKRRMISNRESARRSRMRKQKHLGELYSQVIRLRSVNHQLLNELNHVMGERDQIIQENSLLKNEETELQMKLKDLPAKFACSREETGIS
ncbi:basic leucine zipper 43-like [Curcuma longa]|uniref:basic leucine zipper 43-like n=1 Tax=Curcuma longa TaxID=136217 RepID=UPI003D9E843D